MWVLVLVIGNNTVAELFQKLYHGGPGSPPNLSKMLCDEKEHFEKSPTAESYKEKPFAKHYSVHHPQHVGEPELKLEILARASNTMDRKIKEARAILTNKPDLNDRAEQVDLRKYLV